MFGSLLVVAAGLLTSPVDLEWSAPPQCPSQAEVLARVDGYLQDRPPVGTLRVDAVVTAVEGGWELSVTTVDADGVRQQRIVDDEDCEGLAEVVAVLAALAVSAEPEAEAPNAEAEAPEPEAEVPEPEAPEPEAPEPEAVEPEAVEPEAVEPGPEPEPASRPIPRSSEPTERVPTPDRPRPRVGIRIAGGGGFGWMPSGGELGLAATLSRGWWATELEAHLGLPRQVRVATQDVGADVVGWTVAGRGCGVVPVAGRVDLPLCAGLEGGRLRATPVGLQNETPAAPVWMAALLSPQVRVAVHRRVGLWLMPELQLGLVRPQLHAQDRELEIFAPGVVSGRVRAGVEVVF